MITTIPIRARQTGNSQRTRQHMETLLKLSILYNVGDPLPEYWEAISENLNVGSSEVIHNTILLEERTCNEWVTLITYMGKGFNLELIDLYEQTLEGLLGLNITVNISYLDAYFEDYSTVIEQLYLNRQRNDKVQGVPDANMTKEIALWAGTKSLNPHVKEDDVSRYLMLDVQDNDDSELQPFKYFDYMPNDELSVKMHEMRVRTNRDFVNLLTALRVIKQSTM